MTVAIGIVTTCRSDYGFLKPLIQRAVAHPSFQVRLYVTGSHLSPLFGRTVDEILADAIPIASTIPLDLESDSPAATATALGQATQGFANVFRAEQPDVLIITGDRFEMLGAALSGLVVGVPLAHIGGGDVTHGSLDDAYRHALTKLSHLHFPGTIDSARRIIQMGEEPWRVHAVGELSLDNLLSTAWLSEAQLADRLTLRQWEPPVLVTLHPVTVASADGMRQVDNLLLALADLRRPIVITAANPDAGGRAINDKLHAFAAGRANTRFVTSLGWQAYASLMRVAVAMVGNSSSGIVEAPSFGLPVVNIGTRQNGRPRAANVRDVGYEVDAIRAGLDWALDPMTRARLQGTVNPYGDGQAAGRILGVLDNLPPRESLLLKVFQDG
jgi:UDP-hydrolysing UDP-N-acetyl-D-glucosamine 2-epimerase